MKLIKRTILMQIVLAAIACAVLAAFVVQARRMV